MNDASTSDLAWFFRSIDPIKSAYNDPEFSFLLHSAGGKTVLLNSQLLMSPLADDRPDRVIEAGPFYGFSGRVRSLGMTPIDVVTLLMEARVPAPGHKFELTPAAFMKTRLFRSDQRSSHLDAQQQTYELFGFGLSEPYRSTEDDAWSLRSAATPYGDLNDLYRDLSLARNSHQFHMIAYPPILVDATSRIQGEVGVFRRILANQ